MKKLFLSYSLSTKTPGYGNSESIQIEQTKSLLKQDSCNQVRFAMSNHLGTHIDCPSHFDAHGATIELYPAEFWFSSKVCLLNVPAAPGEMIDLSGFMAEIPPQTEILLVKTGFGKYRHEPIYWRNNPGMSASSGDLLRKKIPTLKMIGFDFISLSSYQNRPEGRLAHQAFLKQDRPGNPILIIEDMDLQNLSVTPSFLVVSPLRIDNLDGAPVTVIAEIPV